MIRLRTVRKEDKEFFWNINQKYLYEMTLYYPDEMDKQGNYHYGCFDAYFAEPERKAFFIYNNEKMIGFVMLNPYSVIGHHPDYITKAVKCRCFYLPKFLSAALVYAPLRSVLNRCPLDI